MKMLSGKNCDRLSDMPDEILHHILFFLPTPESVRTSVLSSRWRHLWRCVPAFHFDVEDLPSAGKAYEPEAVASEAAEKINQFIARRDAACPLLRFHLHINCDIYYKADPFSADIREDYIKRVLLHFLVHSPNLSSLCVIRDLQRDIHYTLHRPASSN